MIVTVPGIEIKHDSVVYFDCVRICSAELQLGAGLMYAVWIRRYLHVWFPLLTEVQCYSAVVRSKWE